MFMFCDPKDILRRNEDRFTMIAVPIVMIMFGIPWAWWIVKKIWGCTIWCCIWEIYVEEEEEKDTKKDN
jgi:hypothetical protein